MNPKIKNVSSLLSHGNVNSRKVVLDLAEATLQKLDAGNRIKSIMRMEGNILHIGVKKWDLSRKRHIYMLGAGKACNAMAMAVDEILGDYLSRGIIIVKIKEDSDYYRNTEVFVGGHPLPNAEGLKGSQEILRLVDSAGPEDLFIVLMSGGSSALMSCPVNGITLQEEIDTTDIILKSGANIYDLNAVRRHISQMNGGMLAKRIAATGAELIGIAISDAVGNAPTGDIGIPDSNYKGTPMGPDQTTFQDARRVLHDYDVINRLPKNVVNYIMNAGPELETPKAFPQNTYFLLNTLPDSCLYAKGIAEDMGLKAIILTSFLEGESKDAGTFMAALARQVQTYGTPFTPPCVILSAGETTTKILDNNSIKGHGGPSLELTAGFALGGSKTDGACMLSIDSEGTDGTTFFAGGLTDSRTLKEAEKKGINLHDALREHAVGEALETLNDAIFTGNTGTNLCDFNILYIPAKGA